MVSKLAYLKVSLIGFPHVTSRSHMAKYFFIESPFHPLRRSLMQSQVENSSLSRRLCTLERTREEDDRLIAEQQAQIEKLLSDRRVLDRQREEAEKRAEDLEDEVAGMKVSRPGLAGSRGADTLACSHSKLMRKTEQNSPEQSQS